MMASRYEEGRGGHRCHLLATNQKSKWWSTLFGNDRTAPFRTSPGIVHLKIVATGSDLVIQPADR
jgi:hypothetical protein